MWCTWNGAGNSAVLVAAVASAVSSPRGTAWSQAPVILAASGRRGRLASPAEPSAAFHALPDLASVRAAQIRNSRSPGILRRSPSSMNFAFAPASSAAIWAIALSMSSHSVSIACYRFSLLARATGAAGYAFEAIGAGAPRSGGAPRQCGRSARRLAARALGCHRVAERVSVNPH